MRVGRQTCHEMQQKCRTAPYEWLQSDLLSGGKSNRSRRLVERFRAGVLAGRGCGFLLRGWSRGATGQQQDRPNEADGHETSSTTMVLIETHSFTDLVQVQILLPD